MALAYLRVNERLYNRDYVRLTGCTSVEATQALRQMVEEGVLAMQSTRGGVGVVAANDIWAVGHSGPNATLIEHWDGTQWSIVPSPSISLGNIGLFGVAGAAADDVGAVGPYVAPVELTAARRVLPGNLRERIRVAGPTIGLPDSSAA